MLSMYFIYLLSVYMYDFGSLSTLMELTIKMLVRHTSECVGATLNNGCTLNTLSTVLFQCIECFYVDLFD